MRQPSPLHHLQIYLFGATVASWKQASGDEVLYVRPDAVFDKSKPISGGIPHCFPQFGPGKMQQHGFARNLDWDVGASAADPNPDELDPYVELVLTDNDYTRAMFPYK
jgi:glucose-6-phosphate 1-epimerase